MPIKPRECRHRPRFVSADARFSLVGEGTLEGKDVDQVADREPEADHEDDRDCDPPGQGLLDLLATLDPGQGVVPYDGHLCSDEEAQEGRYVAGNELDVAGGGDLPVDGDADGDQDEDNVTEKAVNT